MKLKDYLKLLKSFQAIPDKVAREKAVASLNGIVIKDENGAEVDVEMIELTTSGDEAPAGEGEGEGEAAQTDAEKTADAAKKAKTAKVAAAKKSADDGDEDEDDEDEGEDEDAQATRLAKKIVAEQRATAPAGVRSIAIVHARSAARDGEGEGTGENWVRPKNVKPGRNLKNFRGIVNGKSAEERAYRFGMWLLSSLSRQLPGKFSFKAATDFCIEQKLHREGENSSGGYLVPEEFGTDLIDLREVYGVARNIFLVRPMTSDRRTDPRRVSGLTAYFVGEAGCGTQSDVKWDEVALVAKKVMVLSRYTAELDADAVINIGDELAKEIAYAFSIKEDDCAFNGDGSSTYGGIVGARTKIANATAGLVVSTATSWANVSLNDLNSLVGVLPQYADSSDAVWTTHRAFYYGVMRRLELLAGGTPTSEIQNGNRRPRPLFAGYPVEFVQVMPSVSASGQIPALLGDFKKAATFGDRQKDEIAFSEHATVDGDSMFQCNQIAIRGTERFDINVHDVGDNVTAGPIVGLKLS